MKTPEWLSGPETLISTTVSKLRVQKLHLNLKAEFPSLLIQQGLWFSVPMSFPVEKIS